MLVIAGVVYHFAGDQIKTQAQAWFKDGAFDDDGNPVALVFTTSDCGKYCADMLAFLRAHRVPYTELNVSDNAQNLKRMQKLHGGNTYPYLVIGNDKVSGFYKQKLISLLAINFGDAALNRIERAAMASHFDEAGQPIVVLYATSWCGYCGLARKFFAENDINYREVDVERSTNGQLFYKSLYATGYPLIYIGHTAYFGFPNAELEAVLTSS